jgi:hypothetical protein
VAGGTYFGLALGSDDQVYGWGWNGYGDLGNGTWAESTTPVPADFPTGVTPTAIAAGGWFGLATASSGRVYSWGYGDNGQLGTCTTGGTRSNTPVEVVLPPNIQATTISAGFTTAGAVGTDGKVYIWGQNNYGQLGNGQRTDSSCPGAITLPGGIPAIGLSIGPANVLALGSNGQPYAWGGSYSGSTPQAATLPPGVTATSVSGNGWFMIGSDGNAYQWTSWPPTNAPTLIPLPVGVTAVSISAGTSHNMILGSDGNLYAFGSNYDGQLGSGTITDSSTPITVNLPPGTHAVAMSAGNYFGLAVVSSELAPAIVSPPTAGFVSGAAGAFAIQTEGQPTPAITLVGALPAGLSFTDQGNGAASITGTTTKRGTYPVAIRATNGQGPDALQALTVLVGAPPAISAAPTVIFTVGILKTFTIRTSGSPTSSIALIGSLPPYSVFNLPSGLAFSDHGNGTATISGKAAAGTGGTYSDTEFVWNGVDTASKLLNVVVIPPEPTISIGDKSVLEGDSGSRTITFPVTLSAPATTTVSVQYVIAGVTATGAKTRGPGVDFNNKGGIPGTVTFTPNATSGRTVISKTISVTVYGDTTPEPDETFTVTLSNPTGGYMLGRSVGTGTILNDDGITSGIAVGVGDSSIVRTYSGSQTMTVPVTLSAKASGTVSVNYTITPGSATFSAKSTGGDFGGKLTGALSFSNGATAKTINIPIWADPSADVDETFTITLSNLTGNGVTLIRANGTGTILDH